jgi:beta-glucosidase-like glycosyl hydrolase
MGKLRGDFGFSGIVATDCGALNDALTEHNYSRTVCPTCNASEGGDLIAQLAKEAGVDSNCGSFMSSHISNVMAKGMLDPQVIGDSVARLLTLRFKLGLFEPDHPAVPKATIDDVDSPKHRALAHKQSQQSIVLLQNLVHNKTGDKLLPLKKKQKGQAQKVAMIGPNANARLNLLSGCVRACLLAALFLHSWLCGRVNPHLPCVYPKPV